MKRQNFSSKRTAIINLIRNTDIHPSASWIYESLKEEYPNLSLGTVYRNIALFKEQGLIVPVATVDGEERVDGKTKPHAHFVCSECRRVIDIYGLRLNELGIGLEKNGFNVDNVGVTFYGVCDQCSAKRNK